MSSFPYSIQITILCPALYATALKRLIRYNLFKEKRLRREKPYIWQIFEETKKGFLVFILIKRYKQYNVSLCLEACRVEDKKDSLIFFLF
jgi:hypothetical protein